MIIEVHTTFELTLIEVKTLRVMAAFACASLLVNIYDWLRLFESTAFFVTLVEKTLKDIKWFMLLFFLALLVFGVPYSMVNMNRDEESELISTLFFWWVLDIVYNQFMLAIGQFEQLDAFSKGPQTQLMVALYVIATFYTSLTMLNMLIAIMGDTFGNVMESRNLNGIRTKLDILRDMAPVLSKLDG